MAKWDLSKLPEGRKPLPDEWFAERAQMQERIKKLEVKLAKAVEVLEPLAKFSSRIPNNRPDNLPLAFLLQPSVYFKAASIIKELTGGKDE